MSKILHDFRFCFCKAPSSNVPWHPFSAMNVAMHMGHVGLYLTSLFLFIVQTHPFNLASKHLMEHALDQAFLTPYQTCGTATTAGCCTLCWFA